MPLKRDRIDRVLVDRGLAASRDRAQRLVLAGDVIVAGHRIDKPGSVVPTDAAIELRGNDMPYVSRGGLKLASALDHWGIDVQSQIAADLGASTGGFTDCLLQRGAAHVYSIDVGYGQFAWSLRQDPRVTLFERTNLRHFAPSSLPGPVDIAAIDVSFISLELILPTARALLRDGGILLPMVKPQFEVGREELPRGGVVRDLGQRRQAVAKIRACAEGLRLSCRGDFDSALSGPKGNIETFLYLVAESA